MRKPLALFAAAALSMGAFAFLGYDSAVFGKEDQQKSGQIGATASGRASLPQGTTKSEQADEQGIRNTLRQVTIAVIKEDGKNLTNYLSSSDRMRLRNIDASQFKEKLDALRKEFKNKYQEDFQPDEMVFGKSYDTLIIVQGEVVNPALLSNFPVQSGGSSSGRGSSGTGTSPRSDASSSSTSGGLSGASSSSTSADRTTSGAGASATADRTSSSSTDRNTSSTSGGLSGSSSTYGQSSTGGAAAAGIKKGFAVAIVTFPPTQNAPEVIVSLVRESDAAGAGGAGGATGTGSPRSDASSTSGADSSTSGAATATADRAGTSGAGASATADRSSTSSGSSTIGGRASGAGAAGAAGGEWKVKVPDNITAQQLQQNLSKHIDEVTQMKDKWPADKTEAYRTISQHVFAAFYETASTTGGGLRGGAGTGTSGSSTGSGLGTGTSGDPSK